MKYEFIKANQSSVTLKIYNEIVVFEQGDITERHEYSASYFMDGYIGDEKKYQAIADFEYGSDDFIQIEEVELHEDYKELV